MSNREYNPIDYANIADNDTIIDTTIKAALDSIVNTCDICRVVSVTDNRCDVELLQGGKIIDVPILSPAFNGWTFSYPIKKDDTGILVYTKYESDEYFTSGDFTCKELAMFSKNNALFIPFALYNQPAVTDNITLTNENVNITINKDNEISVSNEKASVLIDSDGNIFIKGSKTVIDADNIELGNSATEPLVLGTKFLTEINNIITLIKTHTHGSNGGGPIPASPDLAAGLNPLQNNILSQVSKTK